MTQPNLDALAKLGPFTGASGEVWPRGCSFASLTTSELAAICNEWVELRAEVEELRRDNQSMDSRIRGDHD